MSTITTRSTARLLWNRPALCLFLLLAGPFAASSAPAQSKKLQPQPVTVHEIEAKAVDQTFRIQVAMPTRAASSTKRYPVIYATDISSPMDALAEGIEMLAFGGEIPELIVVGIGYPVESMLQTLTVRARDLTPVADPSLASQSIYGDILEGVVQPAKLDGGGGPEFLEFIHGELIPFIDANYPTTDDRAYFGDSLGGLFGLYVLLERPETFDRYILGSPSMWVGEEWILELAETATRERNDLAARVFVGVGGNEEIGAQAAPFRMVSNVGRLESILTARDFPGLRLVTHIFPDETHLSVVYMNLFRGLRKVYDPEPSAFMEAMQGLEAQTDPD